MQTTSINQRGSIRRKGHQHSGNCISVFSHNANWSLVTGQAGISFRVVPGASPEAFSDRSALQGSHSSSMVTNIQPPPPSIAINYVRSHYRKSTFVCWLPVLRVLRRVQYNNTYCSVHSTTIHTVVVRIIDRHY